MTFKYGLTIPANGANKLARFKIRADFNMPDLEYRLPSQTPIKSGTLTVCLKSREAAVRVRVAFPSEFPDPLVLS